MSYARVLCVGLVGTAEHVVEVEADLAPGLPGVVITGLPDTALHEARDASARPSHPSATLDRRAQVRLRARNYEGEVMPYSAP
ncbi:hypothetical protein AB0F68_16055 [Micromonospora sp. NPDC023966]|uniref:hypothetical protein n=1 Tax=Micromonospora sp. NPDC023966 TaxID=3154699 RepID=UPI00340A7965